ncbi:hypothetical protein FOMPIDRAFT_1081375, partial [Fomitopsis schrenkii]
FSETSSGKHVPCSLRADLEPNTIDKVRSGTYRSLFHLKTPVTGQEDAANDCEFVTDELRRLSNTHIGLQGFFVSH